MQDEEGVQDDEVSGRGATHMRTRVYYNEHDPAACEWLRELMKKGMIPEGEIDERSIADVQADDLKRYAQCHFFAGIGGWPLALRLAGAQDLECWTGSIPEGDIDERSIADVGPDDLKRYTQCHFFAGIGGWPLALRLAGAQDLECWTGSCPCQPFSAAGKKRGTEDERHLWPQFRRLIAERRPQLVVGEQVEAAVAHGWLDLVSSDLEEEGYAVGSVVMGAHSVGAPHLRQRLYWGGVLADADNYEGGGKLVLTAAPSKAGHETACGTTKTCRTTKACRTKRACRTTKSAAAGRRI